MNNYPASMPWLIVRVCGQTYALPSFDVRELAGAVKELLGHG